MSQIAMYSGVYEDIREYAELLDKVLIDLKGGNSSPNDAIRRKLADLLKSLLKIDVFIHVHKFSPVILHEFQHAAQEG